MNALISTPSDAPDLSVTCVAAFSDNYLWLIHSPVDPSRVLVVDPGDAHAIINALDAQRLTLEAILTTHHHEDHVGGVAELVDRYRVPVYGPTHDAIPRLTHALKQDDVVSFESLGLTFTVFDVPGHTAGHIAYYGHGALFCGDTLFSGGCGRLFEGTPAQMLRSLDTLSALPAETLIYCAHEYTESNLRFARVCEPDNAALVAYQDVVMERRKNHVSTIPSVLAMELSINPFLRSRSASIRSELTHHRALGAAVTDVDAFAALREWKNEFKG